MPGGYFLILEAAVLVSFTIYCYVRGRHRGTCLEMLFTTLMPMYTAIAVAVFSWNPEYGIFNNILYTVGYLLVGGWATSPVAISIQERFETSRSSSTPILMRDKKKRYDKDGNVIGYEDK